MKIEPREADAWLMPSPALVSTCADRLLRSKQEVADLLHDGKLMEAVEVVDTIVFAGKKSLSTKTLARIQRARQELAQRRTMRAARGR